MNFYQGIIEKCLAISSVYNSITNVKRLVLPFVLIETEVVIPVGLRSALGCTVDACMLQRVLIVRTCFTVLLGCTLGRTQVVPGAQAEVTQPAPFGVAL